MREILRRIKQDDVLGLGAQMAYNFLFAFFPFLIFLIALLGLSKVKSDDVLAGLQRAVPLQVYQLIEKTVKEVIDNRNIKLLSFGIITSILTAANGFLAVIKGLNKAYDEEENRGFLKLQLTAIISTIILALIIALSIILIIFGEVNGTLVLKHLKVQGDYYYIWNVVRYTIVFILMIVIFIGIYYFTPCRKLKWKEVIPGSIFTTFGWVAASEGFSFYINNFNNYSKIYGSIGVVIIFMTWLFLISIIMLLGGEINATLAFSKQITKK